MRMSNAAMKLRHLLPLAGLVVFTACDQTNNTEAQRLAEERAALEREKATLAEERATAQLAANEQERMRLDAERAALERERAKMAGDREAAAAADREAKLAKERADRMAAEQRAASEAAARRAAETREREAREAAARAAEQARTAQTIDFFYDALDPHGDWVETDRYGYAFRPRVARDARWRPYTDGAWVHTDYGWTWRSNEPFGWATYHYGRWARAPRLGWVWVPGSEWGPAWVSWRRGDDYIGWAPLPPDAWSSSGFNASVDAYFDIGPGLYVFLRVRDFVEPTYVGRVVEPERNVTIINQTVNVTNVTYQTVQNKVTIVNRGPDLAVINQHAPRPVPQMKIERVSAGAPQPAKVQGNVLQMIAPFLKAAQPGKKPAQVKEQVKAAEFEHGWREAKGEATKIRAAAQQEARRAEEEQRKPQRATPTAPPVRPTAPADRPTASPIPPAAAEKAKKPAQNERPAPGKVDKPGQNTVTPVPDAPKPPGEVPTSPEAAPSKPENAAVPTPPSGRKPNPQAPKRGDKAAKGQSKPKE